MDIRNMALLDSQMKVESCVALICLIYFLTFFIYSTVEPPISDLDVRLRWSCRGSFTNSNLTDGGTNRDFG